MSVNNKRSAKDAKVKSILVSQPEPKDPASPYFRLAKKWDLELSFRKFIQVEGISLNEFRKLGVKPLDYSAVIFTSKVAVDHFFRLMNEMRTEMPPETKYFCVGETTSKYLQKYITIRKRKLFVGERKALDLWAYIEKNAKEKFLFPCSNVHRRELPGMMKEKGIHITEAPIYQTVASDLSNLKDIKFDMICFFSPSGIKSLFKNFPNFDQNNTRIAVFGPTTAKEAVKHGLSVDIEAPRPNMPSMTAAIERYLREQEDE
jgi:uroporphyrinogen-III synthase